MEEKSSDSEIPVTEVEQKLIDRIKTNEYMLRIWLSYEEYRTAESLVKLGALYTKSVGDFTAYFVKES